MSNQLRTVKVVYDLRVLPPTFDFMGFVCMADGLRRLRAPETDGIDLLIVYGQSLRGDEFVNVATQTAVIEERLYTMLLPLASLLPCVKSISLLDSRMPDFKISLGPVFFPLEYSPSKPELYSYYKNSMLFSVAAQIDIRSIECSDSSLQTASGVLHRLAGVENPIVVTLRNNAVSRDRSRDNMKEYLQLASQISAEYPVVIIPDTSDVGNRILTDLPVCYEAALDVRIRAAIYQHAKANIHSNNGTAILSLLNKKSSYFQADLATGQLFDKNWFEQQGLLPGENPFSHGAKDQFIDFEKISLEKVNQYLADISRV
jgi:hypothetical protein